MKKLIIAIIAAVLTASWIADPYARADQYDLLKDLHDYAIPTSKDVSITFHNAEAVCHNLRIGEHPFTVITEVAKGTGLSTQEATMAVALTVKNVCTDMIPVLASLLQKPTLNRV